MAKTDLGVGIHTGVNLLPETTCRLCGQVPKPDSRKVGDSEVSGPGLRQSWASFI